LAPAVNLNVLDLSDKLIGTVLLMFGGLMTAILVGYKILPQADAELAQGLDNTAYRRAWAGFVRYVAPPVLLIVLILSLPKVWTSFKTLVGM
jgi:SNF family Na+-dependent transporter